MPRPIRSSALLAAALLAACGDRPIPNPGVRAAGNAPSAVACRQEADRVVLFRDRGQLMREDEREARVGVESSIYARRGETDRLGRIFERDRLAADCANQGTAGTTAPAGLSRPVAADVPLTRR